MRHITTFQTFVNEAEEVFLNDDQIELLDQSCQGQWMVDPKSGLVNVRGNVDLSGKGLTDFLDIRFGGVNGNFHCKYNQLINLEGAPQSVGGNFDCSYNQLTTLEGAPQEVDGNFYCRNNQLTTLGGAPQEVGGDLYFSGNPGLPEDAWEVYQRTGM